MTVRDLNKTGCKDTLSGLASDRKAMSRACDLAAEREAVAASEISGLKKAISYLDDYAADVRARLAEIEAEEADEGAE